MEALTFTITPQDAGRTLLAVLVGEMRLSRSLIRRLKPLGGICVNGQPIGVRSRLQPGDVVTIHLPPGDSPGVIPEPLDLDIHYIDDDLIILNKPSGMLVHPTKKRYTGTLANGLAHYFLETGQPPAIHPVHRLDEGTSGLVLFARHGLAHMRLDAQLRVSQIERRYVAVVHGLVTDAHGTIDAPILETKTAPIVRTLRAVAEGGVRAVTHYQVICRDRAQNRSWLDVRLETGRTHQIRLHMAHIGHPLLGDSLYGIHDDTTIGRHALHAYQLSFQHPRRQEPLTFYAPLPDDLLGLIHVESGDG